MAGAMDRGWVLTQLVISGLICSVFTGLAIYEGVRIFGEADGDARSILLAIVCASGSFTWFTWFLYQNNEGGNACICDRFYWLFNKRLPLLGKTYRWIKEFSRNEG